MTSWAQDIVERVEATYGDDAALALSELGRLSEPSWMHEHDRVARCVLYLAGVGQG